MVPAYRQVQRRRRQVLLRLDLRPVVRPVVHVQRRAVDGLLQPGPLRPVAEQREHRGQHGAADRGRRIGRQRPVPGAHREGRAHDRAVARRAGGGHSTAPLCHVGDDPGGQLTVVQRAGALLGDEPHRVGEPVDNHELALLEPPPVPAGQGPPSRGPSRRPGPGRRAGSTRRPNRAGSRRRLPGRRGPPRRARQGAVPGLGQVQRRQGARHRDRPDPAVIHTPPPYDVCTSRTDTGASCGRSRRPSPPGRRPPRRPRRFRGLRPPRPSPPRRARPGAWR